MKLSVVFLFLAFAFSSAEEISPNFDAFRDCRLLLTTRENRGNPTLITLGNLNSINQSSFDRNRPLRIS
jgi:hypothetical protein